MKKQVEQTAKNKRYFILLLLLILLLGIWNCPNNPNQRLEDEIQQEKDSSQLAKQTVNEEIYLDTITSPIKKSSPISESISPKDPPKIKPTPLKENEAPAIKQEEITPVEEIIPEEVNDQPEIQNQEKDITPPPPIILRKSCTSIPIQTINKSEIQLCVAVSPNGKQFATGDNKGGLTIFDMNGKEITKLIDHKLHVSTADFSPNGKYIVTGSVDETAKLWDLSSGKLIRTIEDHTDHVATVNFSPNGKYIATGSKDNSTILWNTKTGKRVFQLKGHKGDIVAVAFSPDEQKIFTGGVDPIARLWDIQSGKVLLELKGYQGLISSVVFTPDGKFILAGTSKGKAILWNAQSGKHIRTMNCHRSEIRSIDISSDGQCFITASGDHTIKYWQLLNGKELCELNGHSGEVIEADFHPINNNLVISTSLDKTIKIWKINFEQN